MEWIIGLRAEWLTPIMKGFTFLGDEEFFLLFLPLAYWLWRKEMIARTGMVLLFSFVLNALIKGIFQIPRPLTELHLVSADDWSFPSGHAQGAMVLWGWLAWEIKSRKTSVLFPLIILGVGFSRVYLGVHYPQDVVGGFLIGFFTLFAYKFLLDLHPKGWLHLGPTRQSVILFVMLMGLYMLAPEVSEVAVKGGAAFIGFTAGSLHEKRYLNSLRQPGLANGAIKVIIGLLGIILFWIGLKQIFISISFTSSMAMFIRYTLIGAWISYGAPYLFCHFGWDIEGEHK